MSTLRDRLLLTMAIFGAGILTGFIFWDRLSLPFENPFGIIGYCSQIRFNPQNDVWRFLFFILLPSLFLTLFCAWGGGKGRHFLFGGKREVSEPPMEGSEVRLSWRGLVFLPAYAVLLALNVPTYHASGIFDAYHEGEALGTSVSYLAGERPYRDFFFYHGLFQDPLRAAVAFRLFGRSIGAVRTLESALKLSAWVFLALFLGRFFKRRIHLAFGLLTLLALVHVSFLFNLYSAWDAPAVTPAGILSEFNLHRFFFEGINFLIIRSDDLCTFLFAWALAGVVQSGKNPGYGAAVWTLGVNSFVFGFASTAALAYSADRGVYLTAAFLVLAVLFHFIYFRGHPAGNQYRFFCVLGGIGGWLFLGVLLGWDYGSFFQFLFLRMPSYKELSEKVPYPIHSPMFGLVLAVFAAECFWLVRDGWKEAHFSLGMPWLRAWLGRRGLEISLLLLSVFYFRSALTRCDWQHVIYSIAFLLILSFWIIVEGEPGWFFARRTLIWSLCAVTVLFCVWRTVREPVWKRNFPLKVSDSVFLSSPQKQTLGFLKWVRKPGDVFFSLSSNACWYYLLNQPAPTRFPYIWIAALPVFQEEVVRDLSEKKVKWVLYRQAEWYDNIDGIPNQRKLPIISAYIRGHFHPFAKVGGDEIWIRDGS